VLNSLPVTCEESDFPVQDARRREQYYSAVFIHTVNRCMQHSAAQLDWGKSRRWGDAVAQVACAIHVEEQLHLPQTFS
jgi:hypothetical protein